MLDSFPFASKALLACPLLLWQGDFEVHCCAARVSEAGAKLLKWAPQSVSCNLSSSGCKLFVAYSIAVEDYTVLDIRIQ